MPLGLSREYCPVCHEVTVYKANRCIHHPPDPAPGAPARALPPAPYGWSHVSSPRRPRKAKR
jgi:hypothetical protein